jgi:hypothetical protein
MVNQQKVAEIVQRIKNRHNKPQGNSGEAPQASNENYTDEESPMSSKMPADSDWIGPHIISGTGNGPALESETNDR